MDISILEEPTTSSLRIDPEDEESSFLQNVGTHLSKYIPEDCNPRYKVNNPGSAHGSEAIIYGQSSMCQRT
jgi:hypothetical protein